MDFSGVFWVLGVVYVQRRTVPLKCTLVTNTVRTSSVCKCCHQHWLLRFQNKTTAFKIILEPPFCFDSSINTHTMYSRSVCHKRTFEWDCTSLNEQKQSKKTQKTPEKSHNSNISVNKNLCVHQIVRIPLPVCAYREYGGCYLREVYSYYSLFSCGTLSYKMIVKRIEFPSSLLAVILPLWAFTIAYTTDNPIPNPPVFELWDSSIR